MTPANTLTVAAQKLREAAGDAAKASPLPWFIATDGSNGAGVIYSEEYSNIVADRSCDSAEDATDLPYIALMHPDVGLTLADWLDATAAEMEAAAGTEYESGEFASWDAALTVARLLLGEVTE